MYRLKEADSGGFRATDTEGFKKKLKVYVKERDLMRLHKLYEKNWVKLLKEMGKDGDVGKRKLWQYRENLITKCEHTVRVKLKMLDTSESGNCKALPPALKRAQTPLTILDVLTIKHLTKGCKFDIMHSVDDND
jgi:hypothetical protein